MFDEPFRIRASGASLGQRFPFTAPIPGAASNQTLDFSIYEPFNFSPVTTLRIDFRMENTSIFLFSAS